MPLCCAGTSLQTRSRPLSALPRGKNCCSVSHHINLFQFRVFKSGWWLMRVSVSCYIVRTNSLVKRLIPDSYFFYEDWRRKSANRSWSSSFHVYTSESSRHMLLRIQELFRSNLARFSYRAIANHSNMFRLVLLCSNTSKLHHESSAGNARPLKLSIAKLLNREPKARKRRYAYKCACAELLVLQCVIVVLISTPVKGQKLRAMLRRVFECEFSLLAKFRPDWDVRPNGMPFFNNLKQILW